MKKNHNIKHFYAVSLFTSVLLGGCSHAKTNIGTDMRTDNNQTNTGIFVGCIENCTNGQGTMTYENGTKYVGAWKNGLPNGQGTYTFANGDKYEGELKNSYREGQGTFIFASGNKYVGEWKKGLPNGQGTNYYNGGNYVGEWKNGHREGQGTFIFVNGNKYVGEWKNDTFNGMGIYTWEDGREYNGEWQNDKCEGQGTFLAADGKKFVGKFKNSMPIKGQGTLYSENGNPVSNSETNWNEIAKAMSAGAVILVGAVALKSIADSIIGKPDGTNCLVGVGIGAWGRYNENHICVPIR
jgi:hypothetical protein